MKKVVLKLDIHDDKCKEKAMTSVSDLAGVEEFFINANDSKLTVTGDVDPVEVVDKLREICHTEILSVGPANEEKKSEPPKPRPDSPEPEPPKPRPDSPEPEPPKPRPDSPKPEPTKPRPDSPKPEDEYVAWFLKTYGYHPATTHYNRSPLPTDSSSSSSVNPTQPTGSAPANYRPKEVSDP